MHTYTIARFTVAIGMHKQYHTYINNLTLITDIVFLFFFTIINVTFVDFQWMYILVVQ